MPNYITVPTEKPQHSSTGCPMPSCPPLLYSINAFLILYQQYPIPTMEAGQLYASLILDLSATFSELDERVQSTGRFDPHDNWMHNMSQHCFHLFLEILELFPENAVMPNVIYVFEQYLRDPPIMIRPVTFPEFNTRGERERRLSNTSTSSEVSYIQEYLNNLDESPDQYLEPSSLFASYIHSSDQSEYWGLEYTSHGATPLDATQATNDRSSECRVMRRMKRLPRPQTMEKPLGPLSNLRFGLRA